MRLPTGSVSPQTPGLSFQELTTALLLVSGFALACLMPAQNDTWWQLRVGQEIVHQGRVPLEDYLSYTAAGRFWPNHEWLAEVVFHAAHRLGGMPLLQLVAALLVTGALALVATLMPPSRRPLALAVVLPLSATGWALRPHLFTIFFLALMLRLLVRGGARWLPLLFPLWANLHSGVVIAGLVLGVAILVAAGRDRARLPGLAALFAAWGLGAMMTPLGPRLFVFVVTNLSSPVAANIDEWRSARLADPGAVLMVLAALTVCAIRLWRRQTRAERLSWQDGFLLALALVLVALALRSVRHTALAALALGPALGRALAGPETSPPGGDRRRLHGALLGLAAAGALVVVGWSWNLPISRLGWSPMSPAAASAIGACPDPIYNGYDDGGFLLWFVPGKRVFVDSRHDPYPPELMLAQLRVEQTGQHRALFDQYGFRCAVLHPGDQIADPLRAAGWRQTFDDGRWLVLVRPHL